MLLIFFVFSSSYLYYSFNVSVVKPYKVLYLDDDSVGLVWVDSVAYPYSFYNGWFSLDAVVYDLDGDGCDDIIASVHRNNDSLEAVLFAVSGLDGSVFWARHFFVNDAIAYYRGLAGSYYDSINDFIIFFFVGDKLYAVSSYGDVLWSVVLESSLFSPVLGDIDGDGDKEIVFAGLEHVYVLEPLTGDIIFSVNVSVMKCFPVIGDLDGDNSSEIVLLARNYTIITLDSNGETKWKLSLNVTNESPGVPIGFIYLVDIDFDWVLDLIGLVKIYNGVKIFYLEGVSHKLIFYSDFSWVLNSAPAILIDDDNFLFIVHDRFNFHFFDKNGLIHNSLSKENVIAISLYNSLMLVDADNDGLLELFLPDSDSYIPIIDNDNKEVIYYMISPNFFNDFSFVGDFDGDGSVELGFLGGSSVGVIDLPSGFRVYWPGRGLNDNNFNLALVDGDFDGLSDFSESVLGTNSSSPDSDGDGLPDVFEVENGLDPLDSGDASLDMDGDSLTNIREYEIGTRIFDSDTDNDGLADNIDSFPTNSLRPAEEIWIINTIALITAVVVSVMKKRRQRSM